MLDTIKLTKVIKNIKYNGMTTVKWYLSSSGSSLILLNLSEAHHLDVILVLSIIQKDNKLGALHFAMR